MTKEAVACACGCGLATQRTFRPGHDAKLKSQLIADFRAAKHEAERQYALDAAAVWGWAHFMTDKPVRVRKTKAQAPKVEAAPVEAPAGFHPVRVKIGRWTYDAVILSESVNEVTVRYQKPKNGGYVETTVKRSALVNG